MAASKGPNRSKLPLDATVIEADHRWWMFVNIQEEGATVNWDELHLYYSESLLGPWKATRAQSDSSDVRSARPAGRLFWSNNVLYRPSQDSSRSYGYAMTINEVESLTPSTTQKKKYTRFCLFGIAEQSEFTLLTASRILPSSMC
jgi:hypothetical protein